MGKLRTGISPEKPADQITAAERRGLRQWLKEFSLDVVDHRGFDEAIVTAGGVSLREIDPRTMQSRLVGGLYVAGEALERLRSLSGSKGNHRPIELKRRLQRLMWKNVGPLRDGDGLQQALEGIESLRAEARELRIAEFNRCNPELTDAIELPHMLAAAEAIAVSALERRESRGAHVRADFPEHDTENPVENVLIQMSNGRCNARRVEAGE